MDERLFSRLVQRLEAEPVVMATVWQTHGATPRRSGSKMLITAQDCEFSVGGGEAEVRVVAAARALLSRQEPSAQCTIDLDGQPGAAGICGGHMSISLRRWSGPADHDHAKALAAALARGEAATLVAAHADTAADGVLLRPNDRLLIVGAGHCGHALYQAAMQLEFDVWVFDEREALLETNRFARAHRISGPFERLLDALETPRRVLAVLVSRDYPTDVAALRVLCRRPPAFLGMMGSQRRIHQVRSTLSEHSETLQHFRAPIGLEIDAQTPAEIAISILAELVQWQRETA